MNRGDIIIRDVRVKSHFVIDDEYLNGFAKICGPNATLVYLCLCRHADSGQKSFPSIKLMAEKSGTSKRSVIRGIRSLIECNIITKVRVRNPNTGRWWNNSYILLDKSVWRKEPGAIKTSGDQVPNLKRPGAKNDTYQVPQGHTKDSHIKDSHIRIDKINEIRKNLEAKKTIRPLL